VLFTDLLSLTGITKRPHQLPLTLPQVHCYGHVSASHANISIDGPKLKPSPNYGGSYLFNTVQALQQEDQAAGGPRDELRQYLKSGVEIVLDIVGWWGVSLTFFECASPNLTKPEQHPVSHIEADRSRLPCNPRVGNSIQACIQQWRHHWLPPSKQVEARNLRRPSVTQEHVQKQAHLSHNTGSRLCRSLQVVFGWWG
jgi:hypothetical protein